MPKAGFCAQCQENVWLTIEGACPNGHDSSQLSNIYEAEVPGQDAASQFADDFQATANQAADNIEDAAAKAGAAVKGAWETASPEAKEAAEAAGEAAGKAAEAAKGFGKKLWASAKKQGSSDTGMDVDID